MPASYAERTSWSKLGLRTGWEGVAALLGDGALQLYSDPKPLTSDDDVPGKARLLVSFPIGVKSFTVPEDGGLLLATALSCDPMSPGGGVATWARFTAAAGSAVCDLAVSEDKAAASGLILTNAHFGWPVACTISSWEWTGGWPQSSATLTAVTRAFEAKLAGGTVRFYEGLQPASADEPLADQRLAGQVALTSPMFESALPGALCWNFSSGIPPKFEARPDFLRISTSSGAAILDAAVRWERIENADGERWHLRMGADADMTDDDRAQEAAAVRFLLTGSTSTRKEYAR